MAKPGTHAAHGPIKPFKFYTTKLNVPAPPVVDDDDGWWAGAQRLVAATAFAAVLAAPVPAVQQYNDELTPHVEDDSYQPSLPQPTVVVVQRPITDDDQLAVQVTFVADDDFYVVTLQPSSASTVRPITDDDALAITTVD